MLIRIAWLSLLILLSSACSKKTDEDNQGQGDANPDTEATPNGTTPNTGATPSTGGTPNGTTPGEESYLLAIGTVQLLSGSDTQKVEVTLTKGNEPAAEQSISGKLTCQDESEAEGTTDAEGKVILRFAIQPNADETCDVRVDFGEGDIISKEKKDLQVAALRDLLQVANNGKLSFKNAPPQNGYVIKTKNCGDNAGMVKWTHDNVVTPITEIAIVPTSLSNPITSTDIKDTYLYGNIANCRFFVNGEEVAKLDYSRIFIKHLGFSITGGTGKIRLRHAYVNAAGTSIVLVVHTPNGAVRLTEATLLTDSGGRIEAISSGSASIDDIAWVKHETGLRRWVVSRNYSTGW